MDEIAILMAAGLGMRMRPLTDNVAKPLVKVYGKPMIETIINSFQYRGVKQIYVVVGYKKEQFKYLSSKYENVTLIENAEYLVKNNISSIYAARDVMGCENCFICEADLYIPNPMIFNTEFKSSCYFGKKVYGYSDDWIFEQNESGKIINIKKGGTDCYNMVGVSYFLKEDAKTVVNAILKAYKEKGHEMLFWDEVVNRQLTKLLLTIHPVKDTEIIEIDTIEELQKLDTSYGKEEPC